MPGSQYTSDFMIALFLIKQQLQQSFFARVMKHKKVFSTIYIKLHKIRIKQQ